MRAMQPVIETIADSVSLAKQILMRAAAALNLPGHEMKASDPNADLAGTTCRGIEPFC